MHELLNKKIIGLEIYSNEEALKFITDQGYLVYVCSGDCCSETWFSEILNLDFLIGNKIIEVKELDLPEYVDGNCRQDYDKFYGFRLATKDGHCTIAFRNSSNGYYGGSCSLVKDFNNVKSKLDLLTSDGEWKSLTHLSDWTAYENTNGSYYKYLKMKAFW